jgi:hypothetical protein
LGFILENDFISLSDDYSAKNVKKANRKRIAMAKETIARFTSARNKIFLDISENIAKNLF